MYRTRSAFFARERDAATARWNRVANLRLLAFMLGALGVGVGIWRNIPALTGAGALLLAGFVVLVAYHNRLDTARRRYAGLWQITEEAGRRLARDWDALPARAVAPASAGHPYARDLDILGHASLFTLLGAVGSHPGATTLRDWLLTPAAPAVVAERQPAVAELAPLIDLRDELTLRGRLMGDPPPDPAPFLAWAEGAPRLAGQSALLWVGRISVVLLWVCVLAQVAGLVALPLWGAFVALNILLNARLNPLARATIEQVESAERAFRPFGESFALLSTASFAAPLLRRVQAILTDGGLDAHLAMRRLYRLVSRAFPPESLLYVPVQLLTLWDVHVLAALEGWQAAAGGRARGWLAALGEAEALAALAVLAHDQPAWAFPAVDPAADRLDARGLGHPLLPPAACVTNDLTVGPPGTFLLVTGSNMSGKSTLLRAIGTNLVLADAGGPVCAAAFHAPPVTLWTSMRIEDSLERGVSYFLAELQRLKGVVDAARTAQTPGARRLFYLLDEILQGTNTAERQIAARRIISFLVQAGALGAVSTHDLALANTPALAAAHLVHFTETLAATPAGPPMTFDYHLRPGLATSSNALRLMALVGLGLDDMPPDG